MPFELFTSSRAPESFISLVKEGFRLSAGFLRAHHLERATAVRLYFDRAKRTVGFHFPTGPRPAEGTLRPRRHDGGLVIRARGFFSSHDIDPATVAGRYGSEEVRDPVLKKLFVIRLRHAPPGQRRARDGKRR